MIKVRNAAFFLCIFFWVIQANAQDVPSVGLLHNTKENSSLTYDCRMLESGLLECSFVQVFVRKKANPEDLQEKIDEAKKQLPKSIKQLKEDDEELCKSMGVMLEFLEGKKSLEQAAAEKIITNKNAFIEEMGAKSNEEKEQFVKVFRPFLEFCNNPNESNLLKMVKAEHGKDLQTCRVGSNTFTQRFRYVEDYDSNGAWVVESKPEGPCGIVQLSRFEPEVTEIGISEFTSWNYVAKKAITNPKGQAILFECDKLDEDEYFYDWKSKEYYVGCNIIEFSPF